MWEINVLSTVSTKCLGLLHCHKFKECKLNHYITRPVSMHSFITVVLIFICLAFLFLAVVGVRPCNGCSALRMWCRGPSKGRSGGHFPEVFFLVVQRTHMVHTRAGELASYAEGPRSPSWEHLATHAHACSVRVGSGKP